MHTDTDTDTCPGILCDWCAGWGMQCDRYTEAHSRTCRMEDCSRPAAPGSPYCPRCRDDVAAMDELAQLKARRMQDAADCRVMDSVSRWCITLAGLLILWYIASGFVGAWVR